MSLLVVVTLLWYASLRTLKSRLRNHQMFKHVVGRGSRGVLFMFDDSNNEFVWKLEPISIIGERTVDGFMLPRSLVTTRSQVSDGQP